MSQMHQSARFQMHYAIPHDAPGSRHLSTASHISSPGVAGFKVVDEHLLPSRLSVNCLIVSARSPFCFCNRAPFFFINSHHEFAQSSLHTHIILEKHVHRCSLPRSVDSICFRRYYMIPAS